MEKTKATIQLHKPSRTELAFFLLSGAVVSVPLTLFIEQNFASPLLTGLSATDISLLNLAVFAPCAVAFAKAFALF